MIRYFISNKVYEIDGKHRCRPVTMYVIILISLTFIIDRTESKRQKKCFYSIKSKRYRDSYRLDRPLTSSSDNPYNRSLLRTTLIPLQYYYIYITITSHRFRSFYISQHTY